MPHIRWKLHLRSSPDSVYEFLNTNEGRKKFWAESAIEIEGYIHFIFINGLEYRSKIIERKPVSLFSIDYFNSKVRFDLKADSKNGTELTLNNFDVQGEDYTEINAGWVSVLLTLKASADFKVDLRNHNKERCWDQLFAEN